MDGVHWVGSALVPCDFIIRNDLEPFEDAIIKYKCTYRNENETIDVNLSMIVQIMPQTKKIVQSGNPNSNGVDIPVIRLHPLVEEFLVYMSSAEGSSASSFADNDKTLSGSKCDGTELELESEPEPNTVIIQHAFMNFNSQTSDGGDILSIMSQKFSIEKITSTFDVSDSNSNSNLEKGRGIEVSLKLLITSTEDGEKILRNLDDLEDLYEKEYLYKNIRRGLEGRTIRENTIVAISLPLGSSCEEVVIFHIDHISTPKDHDAEQSDQGEPHGNTFYAIESCEYLSVTLHFQNDQEEDNDSSAISATSIDSETINCPGYEDLVKEILGIARITLKGGSPTGVLLTGCAGVGKTRLATALIHKLFSGGEKEEVKILSCKSIILYASSTLDLTQLKGFILNHVMVMKDGGRRVLVLDDLDAVMNQDDDSSTANDEVRMSLHAIAGVIDDLNATKEEEETSDRDIPPFIMGICCDEGVNIPPTLARVGRFEKTVSMQSPTEKQRQAILHKMLQSLEIQIDDNYVSKEECYKSWSSALAPHTSGCVAADMKRICIDAKTRSKARSQAIQHTEDGVLWEDIREAVRTCVPSQLAQLDVSLTREIDDNPETTRTQSIKKSPRDIFFRSWERFGGYEETKAKIYRTVVWPWKRHHIDSLNDSGQTMSQLEKEVLPPKGVIFCGPSGCGKTFAADRLAISMGLNVVRVRASDVLNKWLGGSEAAIRAIFARARAASPCILFFDELDSIATNREDGDGDASDVHSRLLSTLLNEMDGVNTDRSENDILVVATTNRLGAIDAALLRPGRFEEHIMLEKPEIDDICDIMTKCLGRAPLSSGTQIYDIAELLHELEATTADVKGICAEACSHAIDNADSSARDVEKISLDETDFDVVICRWKK